MAQVVTPLSGAQKAESWFSWQHRASAWASTFKFALSACAPCNSPLSSPGWLHVRSRRGGQHPRKQTDWLALQNVAGGAQPAGTVVGEAPRLLPSPSHALQSSAFAPRTDAGTRRATKMRPSRASAPGTPRPTGPFPSPIYGYCGWSR